MTYMQPPSARFRSRESVIDDATQSTNAFLATALTLQHASHSTSLDAPYVKCIGKSIQSVVSAAIAGIQHAEKEAGNIENGLPRQAPINQGIGIGRMCFADTPELFSAFLRGMTDMDRSPKDFCGPTIRVSSFTWRQAEAFRELGDVASLVAQCTQEKIRIPLSRTPLAPAKIVRLGMVRLESMSVCEIQELMREIGIDVECENWEELVRRVSCSPRIEITASDEYALDGEAPRCTCKLGMMRLMIMGICEIRQLMKKVGMNTACEDRTELVRCMSNSPHIEITAFASNRVVGVDLCIKNLDGSTDDDSLRTLLEPFGAITSASAVKDEKGVCTGFGFVSFKSPDDATKAVTEMHLKVVKGKPLCIGLDEYTFDAEASQCGCNSAVLMTGEKGYSRSAIRSDYLKLLSTNPHREFLTKGPLPRIDFKNAAMLSFLLSPVDRRLECSERVLLTPTMRSNRCSRSLPASHRHKDQMRAPLWPLSYDTGVYAVDQRITGDPVGTNIRTLDSCRSRPSSHDGYGCDNTRFAAPIGSSDPFSE